MICDRFEYVERGFKNMRKPDGRQHESCGNCTHAGQEERQGWYCKVSGELL